MKRLILQSLLLAASLQLSLAQEIPLTNLKFTDGVTQFPALTGGSGGSVYLSNRTGLGISGAGKSQLAGGHLLLSKQRLGLGLSLYHDRLNVLDNYNIALQNAYHIPLGQKRILSFGLGTEGHYSSIGSSSLVEVDINDPRLLNGNTWTLDFTPSVAFQTKSFKIALAHNRITSALGSETGDDILNPYASAMGVYKWKISDQLLLEPSYTLRYSQLQKTFRNDLQVIATVHDQYFAGATWRSENVLNASFGLQFLHKYVVGYSYQTTIGDLVSVYGTNTHEIVVRFNLNEQFYNREDFLLDAKPIRTIKNFRR